MGRRHRENCRQMDRNAQHTTETDRWTSRTSVWTNKIRNCLRCKYDQRMIYIYHHTNRICQHARRSHGCRLFFLLASSLYPLGTHRICRHARRSLGSRLVYYPLPSTVYTHRHRHGHRHRHRHRHNTHMYIYI